MSASGAAWGGGQMPKSPIVAGAAAAGQAMPVACRGLAGRGGLMTRARVAYRRGGGGVGGAGGAGGATPRQPETGHARGGGGGGGPPPGPPPPNRHCRFPLVPF